MFIDHIFSFTQNSSLESELERFKEAGFHKEETTAFHSGGLETGFLRMSGTYLELLTVADEKEFQLNANEGERFFREIAHPYGISFRCKDSKALYDKLDPNSSCEYMEQTAKESHGAKVTRQFCVPGVDYSLGALVFTISYSHPSRAPLRSRFSETISSNNLLGIGGVYFCDSSIGKAMGIWKNFLDEIKEPYTQTDRAISFGVQSLNWISPDEYRDIFGKPWVELGHKYSSLAAVKLFSSHLGKSKEAILNSSLKLSQDTNSYFSTVPDNKTGFSFFVEERDEQKFLNTIKSLF